MLGGVMLCLLFVFGCGSAGLGVLVVVRPVGCNCLDEMGRSPV